VDGHVTDAPALCTYPGNPCQAHDAAVKLETSAKDVARQAENKPKPAPKPKPIVNCFAQLKYRPTLPKDNKMNHSSWYVQGSDGVQHTLTGGPDPNAPGAPPSGFLNMWDKKPEDLSALVSFDSKLSPANCKSVDAMIKAVHRFPNNTITYDWRGPNSNGTARYLGNVGGYSPAAPPLSTGWSTPIPGVE